MEVVLLHVSGSTCVYTDESGRIPEGSLPGFTEGYVLLDGVRKYVGLQDGVPVEQPEPVEL